MKRIPWIVCLLLFFVVLIGVIPDSQTGAQDTVPDGYIGIFDRADLEKISKAPEGKYILMADLDLSGAEWKPLCTEDEPFAGIFDGNDHKILGMTVSDSVNGCGLFSYLCGGTVKSLTLSGTASGPIAGLVAGKISKGEILDCTVEGTVTSSFFGGGIAGQVCGTAVTLSGCVSKATLVGTGSTAGELHLGGLVGAVYGKGHVLSEDQFTGTLKPTGATLYAGGIAGVVDADAEGIITLSACRSEGKLTLSYTETACLGGIVGRIGGRGEKTDGTVEVKNCSFSGTWSGSGCGKPLFLGGIVGKADATGTVSVTQCSGKGSLTGVGHVKFVNPDDTGYRCPSCGETLGHTESQNNGMEIVEKNFGLRYSSYVGGILGQGIADGGTLTVSQCSSSASLKAVGSPLLLGQIAGMFQSSEKGTAVLEDCVSGGKITDTFPIHGELASAQGGIVGFLGGSGTTTLQRCFSTCELFVDYSLCDGAIAGLVSPYYGGSYPQKPTKPTVTGCYFLTGVRDYYGIALSGSQVSDPATYLGFDFTAVWKIDPVSGLPNLQTAGLTVESTPLGDVDGNGKVTRYDAILLTQYLTGNATLTSAQQKRADYDKNGVLDSMDASLILQKAS